MSLADVELCSYNMKLCWLKGTGLNCHSSAQCVGADHARVLHSLSQLPASSRAIVLRRPAPLHIDLNSVGTPVSSPDPVLADTKASSAHAADRAIHQSPLGQDVLAGRLGSLWGSRSRPPVLTLASMRSARIR